VFFSSRRRHTRSKRDWSSDVCSSDLSKTSTPWQVFWPITSRAPHIAPYDRQTHPSRTLMSTHDVTIPDTLARPVTAYLDHLTIRSEERRVGNERTSEKAPCRAKKDAI